MSVSYYASARAQHISSFSGVVFPSTWLELNSDFTNALDAIETAEVQDGRSCVSVTRECTTSGLQSSGAGLELYTNDSPEAQTTSGILVTSELTMYLPIYSTVRIKCVTKHIATLRVSIHLTLVE